MGLLEKLQTVFMLAAIALGFAAGEMFPAFGRAADSFIVPALTAMLFGLFLGIPLKDLKLGFLNFKFTIISLGLNFLWIPVLGWILGGLFLQDSPALRLGFLMLLVTPCTDWYLAFTALARGNVALSAALLPINLTTQVLLLPLYLVIFSGLTGRLDLQALFKSIALVLVLPFGLAQAVRHLFSEENPFRNGLEKIFPKGQFIFLCLAIIAMFASQADQLKGNLGIFLKLLPPVLLFFFINFWVGRATAKLAKMTFADSVSLNLTTLARNSPISLAIAVTAFPDEPLVALALVIGPLIELPALGIISQVLLRMGKNQRHGGRREFHRDSKRLSRKPLPRGGGRRLGQ